MNGKITGDVDLLDKVIDVASSCMTPVPGGVGALNYYTYLMKNVCEAIEVSMKIKTLTVSEVK